MRLWSSVSLSGRRHLLSYCLLALSTVWMGVLGYSALTQKAAHPPSSNQTNYEIAHRGMTLMTIPTSDEFRVPGKDTQGHSSRVWCTVQPDHERLVDIIVQSRRFPYRTKGDLYRHAIDRHVKWLETLGGEGISSIYQTVDVILDVMREEERHADFRAVFDPLATRIANYLSQGQIDMAASLAARINSHIEAMPDGMWKEKYQAEMVRRFGYLLRTGEGEGIRLMDSSGDV